MKLVPSLYMLETKQVVHPDFVQEIIQIFCRYLEYYFEDIRHPIEED